MVAKGLARSRAVGAAVMCALMFHSTNSAGWSIGGIDIPLPKQIPIPDDWKRGTPASGSSESSGSDNLIQMLSCGLGGLAGAAAAKKLARAESKKKKMSKSQESDLMNRYMLGLGLAGCAGGHAAAKVVLDKLSEQAKKKREEAVQAAIQEEAAIHQSGQQPSGKPYAWEADGAAGQVTIAEVSSNDGNGTVCVVVDENVDIGGENYRPLTKRCNTPPSTEWVATA